MIKARKARAMMVILRTNFVTLESKSTNLEWIPATSAKWVACPNKQKVVIYFQRLLKTTWATTRLILPHIVVSLVMTSQKGRKNKMKKSKFQFLRALRLSPNNRAHYKNIIRNRVNKTLHLFTPTVKP